VLEALLKTLVSLGLVTAGATYVRGWRRLRASRYAPPRWRLALYVLGLATLAAAEEAQSRQRFLLQRRDPAQTSALRTHGLRRAQVHFKCDNSAKV